MVKIIVFLITLTVTNAYTQRKEEVSPEIIIKLLKTGNLEQATLVINRIDTINNKAASFLPKYVYYLKKGVYKKQWFPTRQEAETKLSEPYRIMYYYMYGDLMFDLYKNDTTSYNYYLKAKNLAQKEQNKILYNAVLKRILHYFQRKPKNLELYEDYKNQFKSQVQDSVDLFWAKYYDLSFKIHKEWLRKRANTKNRKTILREEFKTIIKDKVLDSLYELTQRNTFLKARALQLSGIYNDVLKGKPEKAARDFEKAKQLFQESPYFYSKKEAIRANINKAFALKLKRKYKEAIVILNTSVKSLELNKGFTEKRVVYQQLSDCYDSLKEPSKAKLYLDKKIMMDAKINDYMNAEKIHHYDYQNRIDITLQEKEKLSQNNLFLFIVSSIILIIAIITFYKWYKSKKKKKALEMANEQLIEKNEKIKQLVIQDRIVLKNKIHILLEELIYIKVEDHYLALYTNEKKEFVRGKIKDIILQLPPNFCRCHRSYIINKNYIDYVNHKEIKLKNGLYVPLSRTYKNQF